MLSSFLAVALCLHPTPAIPVRAALLQESELAPLEGVKTLDGRTLEATKGNKSRAARMLRTDYTTLHVKMKRYGISARDFMPR